MGAKSDYTVSNYDNELGQSMGTVITAGFGVVLALLVFLVGFGYFVNLAPVPVLVTQPLVLNAQ